MLNRLSYRVPLRQRLLLYAMLALVLLVLGNDNVTIIASFVPLLAGAIVLGNTTNYDQWDKKIVTLDRKKMIEGVILTIFYLVLLALTF
jgi:hypothetical protein